MRQECDIVRAACDINATYIMKYAKSGLEAFKMAFLSHFLYAFIRAVNGLFVVMHDMVEMLIKVLKMDLPMMLPMSCPWFMKNKMF